MPRCLICGSNRKASEDEDKTIHYFSIFDTTDSCELCNKITFHYNYLVAVQDKKWISFKPSIFWWALKALNEIFTKYFGSIRIIPWSNAFWPRLMPFGPPMWQAEADTEMTLTASPTTEVGQKELALAQRRYSTVCDCSLQILIPRHYISKYLCWKFKRMFTDLTSLLCCICNPTFQS